MISLIEGAKFFWLRFMKGMWDVGTYPHTQISRFVCAYQMTEKNKYPVVLKTKNFSSQSMLSQIFMNLLSSLDDLYCNLAFSRVLSQYSASILMFDVAKPEFSVK